MPQKDGERHDESGREYSRRRYLQGIVAGTAGAGLLANAGRVRADTKDEVLEPYRAEFDTIVDVTDIGADDTGTASVSNVIDDAAADDTLLYFPPGRYRMDSQVRFTGFRQFGMVGNDATLVPDDYYSFEGPTYRLFRMGVDYNPGYRLVFDGFTVDQTAPETGIRVMDAVVDDGLEVRDVTIEGTHNSGTFGPGRFMISDPDGKGLVERFEAPDGAVWESETPMAGEVWRGPTGILANMNEGLLRFKDCVLGPFPDNGLYASGGSGRIVVDGGRFENSNASNLRIGGDDSVVRGATVRIDTVPDHFDSQRGIRLERCGRITVEDTDVTITRSDGGTHAVVTQDTCGEAWLENLSITVDTSVPSTGIVVSPSADHTTIVDSDITHEGPGGYSILFEGDGSGSGGTIQNVNISGNAGNEGAAAAIRNLRDDVRFSQNVVDQPGGSGRYALVNLGDDCMVYKGVYRGTQFPILDAGTGTWVEDIYAKSYGDREAYALHDQSADVYLKRNRLRGGYADFGCEGLKTVGNEF